MFTVDVTCRAARPLAYRCIMVGMGNNHPPLIAIIGPTAVGKTAHAIALANELGGEVVSADSRQVYRKLDIGSAINRR